MEAKSIDGRRIIRFASSTTKDEIDENVDKMSGTTKMTPSVFVQLVQEELDKNKSNIDGWDPSSQLTESESGVDKIRRQGRSKILNRSNKELTASVASRIGGSQKIPVARRDVADREQNLELDSDNIESHFLESAEGSSGSHISPTEEPYTPSHRTKTFQSTAEILETLCSKHAAKDILSHERYHDQYASGLYTEMYRLLSDHIDTMDALWSTDERAKLPNPMEKSCTFTRVKNIDRGARFEDYMYGVDTPPFIAQSIKLNAVIDANNKRAMECRAEEKNPFHQSKSYISLKAQKQRHALTENVNIKSKSNSLQM